jgi:hypothetical protein
VSRPRQLAVCLSLRRPGLNPRPVDVNGGGRSISGSGSPQNTSLLFCQYHFTGDPHSFIYYQCCIINLRRRQIKHLQINWGLFRNRWYIFTSLQILAFLFATSRDLADRCRSFGGAAVEESVCRGTYSVTRHCLLFTAVTCKVCDDAWRVRFVHVISDHDPNEQEGDGIKCVYTWRQTVGK